MPQQWTPITNVESLIKAWEPMNVPSQPTAGEPPTQGQMPKSSSAVTMHPWKPGVHKHGPNYNWHPASTKHHHGSEAWKAHHDHEQSGASVAQTPKSSPEPEQKHSLKPYDKHHLDVGTKLTYKNKNSDKWGTGTIEQVHEHPSYGQNYSVKHSNGETYLVHSDKINEHHEYPDNHGWYVDDAQHIPDTKGATVYTTDKGDTLPKIGADASWEQKLEKVQGSLGSNPGGVYKNKVDGSKYYLKLTKDPWIRSEHLATQLYALAGVPVLHSEIIEYNGQLALKTDWEDGLGGMWGIGGKQSHQDVLNNFVVDAWLANWDIANGDNIAKKGTKAIRIDNGGTLTYRAKGGTKPFDDFTVPELKTMRDPALNGSASQWQNLTQQNLEAGAQKVVAITDAHIDSIVDGAGIKGVKANNLKTALKGRRDFIAGEILGLKKSADGTYEKDENWCPPGQHKHPGATTCHPIDQPHATKVANEWHQKNGLAISMGSTSKTTMFEEIANHPSDVFKEILTKSMNTKFIVDTGKHTYNREKLEEFGKQHGIKVAEALKHCDGWQGPKYDSVITVRAALHHLRNMDDEARTTENSFWVYERGHDPNEFDAAWNRGIEMAGAFIPLIAATQQALDEKYKGPTIGHVARGIGKSSMSSKYIDAVKNATSLMKDSTTVSFPNTSFGGWSFNKSTAYSFGVESNGITFLKRGIPKSDVLLWFNMWNGGYLGEGELILYQGAATKFSRDEIITSQDDKAKYG